MFRQYFLILLLISGFVFGCGESTQNNEAQNIQQDTEQQRGEIAKNGMVVSAHPEASKVGVNILKKGGNAIDAAIAVHFALAVVYPNAGNIGGGGFMVYRNKEGNIDALDFRETAPGKAHKGMYLDEEGNVVPRLSLDGHLASGVPGSVDGMFKAHEKYGSLPMKELIQPSVDLAEKGFKITEKQAAAYNRYKEKFVKFNEGTVPLVKEAEWKKGDLLVQPELAQTLTLIKDNGRDGFYKGEVADLIVAEMKKGEGIITHEDLESYESKWRKPVTGNYKEYRVISMPPPSSGGIALVQLMEIVEDFPLRRWGWHTDSTMHLMIEAERRVYADRATHLGDADFYPVPFENLLDEGYIKARIDNVEVDKASKSEDIKAGQLEIAESEQTTHFSIVDKEHNAVSITTTLNSPYGSKVFVEGAGFLLNNEMDDFSAKPGVPNTYGLVGAEANKIEPGKRMLSSMTPTIVEKNNDLFMVVGTPGGSTIITSVFQTILNVTEHDMTMQEAVAAGRFHHQWLPDKVYVESDYMDTLKLSGLKERGHKIQPRGPIGSVDAILVLPDGRLEGGADPRGDDKALGY